MYQVALAGQEPEQAVATPLRHKDSRESWLAAGEPVPHTPAQALRTPARERAQQTGQPVGAQPHRVRQERPTTDPNPGTGYSPHPAR